MGEVDRQRELTEAAQTAIVGGTPELLVDLSALHPQIPHRHVEQKVQVTWGDTRR